eukprot:TRINITY_DN656_c0_g1_i14.p1 TRINITY_DN656_c0_g1~~TRINITY_DN656_c0_g1_i14.p1  ORF type:complete len:593 (+),score=129.13 TRINITY_DN656_c0_g1_i14:248-1780(+)
MDRAILPEERIASQARWASTLEMAGYWRSAYVTWKQLLADSNATVEIEFDGSRQLVSELARQRLSNPAYRTYDDARHVSLRQFERSWTNPSLENTGHRAVLLPQGQPPATGLACVLVHSHQNADSRWDCLDRATGQVRWSRSWTIAPQWCGYSESDLLIAMEGNLVAITLESGTELWSVPVSTSPGVNRSIMAETEGVRIPEERTTKSPPIQIAVRNHFVIAFDPLAGAEVIDARTGKVCWTFAPSRGKLQRQWACGKEHISLQTLQPSATWILDIVKERRVVEGRGSTEPWLQSPVIDVDKEIIAMNTDRNIESRLMQAGRARWVYQGGMSFAHLDPVLWSAGSRVLLTVDGMTLVSINRSTGRADWSVGISDRPLRHPSRQVIAKDEFAYATCQGLLRRISLETGKREWERFLGSATEQWRVVASDEAVAAWPIASSDSVDAKKQNSSFVVWCDGRDGRILHRLNFPRGEQAVEVTCDEQGWLVQTNQSLIAFRPVGLRVDVAAAEKR